MGDFIQGLTGVGRISCLTLRGKPNLGLGTIEANEEIKIDDPAWQSGQRRRRAQRRGDMPAAGKPCIYCKSQLSAAQLFKSAIAGLELEIKRWEGPGSHMSDAISGSLRWAGMLALAR